MTPSQLVHYNVHQIDQTLWLWIYIFELWSDGLLYNEMWLQRKLYFSFLLEYIARCARINDKNVVSAFTEGQAHPYKLGRVEICPY